MQAPPLPASFLARPIAHRALHDRAKGRIENSPAAFSAAIAAGLPIECDLQLSADGVAMVFHDYDLSRLTAAKGAVAQRSAAELGQIPLTDSGDCIPTLAEMLALTAGRVPLLIELKDQDGALGPDIGPLEAATAKALAGYAGDVALMSFNPHSMAEMARIAPGIPRGLTTCDFPAEHWATVPAARRAALAAIPDAARVGAGFVSHQQAELANPRLAELAAEGLPILCWTVRSPAEEAAARRTAQNITFEGYSPAL